MLKRTISVVLSIVMLMSYVTMVTYAAEEERTQAQSTYVDDDISMEGINSLGIGLGLLLTKREEKPR